MLEGTVIKWNQIKNSFCIEYRQTITRMLYVGKAGDPQN